MQDSTQQRNNRKVYFSWINTNCTRANIRKQPHKFYMAVRNLTVFLELHLQWITTEIDLLVFMKHYESIWPLLPMILYVIVKHCSKPKKRSLMRFFVICTYFSKVPIFPTLLLLSTYFTLRHVEHSIISYIFSVVYILM